MDEHPEYIIIIMDKNLAIPIGHASFGKILMKASNIKRWKNWDVFQFVVNMRLTSRSRCFNETFKEERDSIIEIIGPLLVSCEDNFLYLHIVEDVVALDRLTEGHDLVGHESERRFNISDHVEVIKHNIPK
jgi:hypothetical protein